MNRIDQYTCFGGTQEVWEHTSDMLDCVMRLGVYLPPQATARPCPVLYWLSGLTCTEQNFVTKAGAQRYAAEHGVIIVAPDTSPRGDDVADADGYDLGKGAGFYINATESPWAAHYRMYDYIVQELPKLIPKTFPALDRRAISGHSMGGHGALMIALKNPGMFQSVSAFSPIVAPCDVPWGEKAFTAYLGEAQESWHEWDTCKLVATRQHEDKIELFVDQGTSDNFLEPQLQPHRLVEVCKEAAHPLTLRMQEGYDHSYYFIASFIGEHIAYHARALHAAK